MLFDLSTGTLLIPTKALMLDLVPKSQEDMTNLLSSAGVGLLTCLGFGFGAIDWSTVTGNEKSIEKQSEIVFGCTAGIYMIIVLTVVMCIREILPGFLRINQNNSTVYGSIPSQNSAPFTDSANDKIGVTCCMNPFKLLRNSLLETTKFFYHMSMRMWIVFLTFTMAYAAEFSFVYSYTVFVGTVAYKGDPKADVNSHSYLRYSEGVRMGSLGLAIGSFVKHLFIPCTYKINELYLTQDTLSMFWSRFYMLYLSVNVFSPTSSNSSIWCCLWTVLRC